MTKLVGKIKSLWPGSMMAIRWKRLTQHHAFLLGALVLGVALIFGPPLLAQNDDPSHEDPAAASHGSEEAVPAGDHGEGEHAEEGGHGEEGVVHPPNLVTIIAVAIEGHAVHGPEDAKNPVARFLFNFMAPIYSLIVIVVLATLFIAGTRSLTLIPGRFQNFLEWAIEGLAGFLGSILGPEGKKYVPFLGTLFLYIYLQNIFGLIPLGFTPTSMLESTASMAILVFLTVQFTAIRSFGLLGYLKHLAGDPEDLMGWLMSPLLFFIHVVGELAKPISLSMRLFGNMLGEETLLAVFMGIGVSMLAFTQLPIGFPLHIPFIFLALLTTFIQALVFTVLSTIYFAMALPHKEEH
jgi:F-type H+-transporting ATPase subunit a